MLTKCLPIITNYRWPSPLGAKGQGPTGQRPSAGDDSAHLPPERRLAARKFAYRDESKGGPPF